MSARVVLQRASLAEWEAERKNGIGGSDAAAILGLSPWKSPLEVWQEKTGRWSEDLSGQYRVEVGNHMEPFLLAEYARRNPGVWLETPHPQAIPGRRRRLAVLYAHPDHPEVRGSLDGIAHHPDRAVLLEAKDVGFRQAGPWWDDAILVPDHFVVQVCWYLAITALPAAIVIANVAGEWKQVEIPRDEDFEAWAIPYCIEWWHRHVVADEPPAWYIDRDDEHVVGRTFRTDPMETLEATGAALGAWNVAVWNAGRIAALVAMQDRLRAQIRAHMGTAQALTITDPETGRVRKAAYVNKKGALTVRPPKQAAEESA